MAPGATDCFVDASYREINMMNMKQSRWVWLLLLLPFFHVNTGFAVLSARYTNETRHVSGFHAISNSGSIALEVRLGGDETLRLEGDGEAIRNIETVVEQGVLKIRFRRGVRQRNWGKVTAYVTAKQIDGLSQSGSGSVTVLDPIEGSGINASLSGSGKITFVSDTETLNASISGSGRIRVSGQASQSNVSVSGSGGFDGAKLVSGESRLKVAGSGSIDAHVDRQLDAAVSGSGNITYSGDAQANVRTAGSGKVRRR